jgi:O-antigen/teichoic acid export membrane protein
MSTPPATVSDCDNSPIALYRATAVLRRLIPAGIGKVIEHYLQVLAGTFGRLGMQAVYFVVLANTLSLHDMGIFASASATGLMLGCFAGFGFSSFAFRAAAAHPRLLGRYMALFYASWMVTTPLALLLSLPVYFLLFGNSISFLAFAAIILSEAAIWRLSEVIHQVNNGLGRYRRASLVITLASAGRTVGAIVFAVAGTADAEQWAYTYLFANTVTMAIIFLAYRPRVALNLRMRLFLARFRDGMLFSLSYFALVAQNEIDKLIMVGLADERIAGIYAIAMRLIDFTTVPFRTFYVLYSRKLIGERDSSDILRRGLRVEAIIAVLSTLAMIALVTILTIWPDLLGRNVAVAAQLFGVMIAVPAFKNLLEFHSELFFAYQRMTARAIVSISLVAIKAGALALLLNLFNDYAHWGFWLNFLYLGLYVLSAVVVYRTVSRQKNR